MSTLTPSPLYLAAAAVILSMLAGCSPEPAAERPDPSPTPSSSASQTPDALPTPPTRIQVSCGELIPSGLGEGLLVEQLPSLTEETFLANPPVARPHESSTVQTGGLRCYSSNGEAFSLGTSLNPEHVSLSVRLVPGGTAEFEEFRSGYPIEGDRGGYCAEGTPDSCSIGALAEDVWVEVDAYGVDPALLAESAGMPTQMIEIIDGVRELILEAGVAESTWTAPDDTVPPPLECSTLFEPERIKAEFGIGDPVYLGVYEDYAGAERAARLAAPAASCPWLTETTELIGEHSILTGGQWAFDQLDGAGEFSGYDPVPLDGLGEGDSAVSSCSAIDDACVAQAAIGRNWVYVAVMMSQNGLDEASAREKLTGLVQTAVDVIRG